MYHNGGKNKKPKQSLGFIPDLRTYYCGVIMDAFTSLKGHKSSFPQISLLLFELFKFKLVVDILEWDYSAYFIEP
jgi:hypothetical protein